MKAKQWSANEDAALLGYFSRYSKKNSKKTPEEIDKLIAKNLAGRTANAIRQRRSKISAVGYTRKKGKQQHPNQPGHRRAGTFAAPLQLNLMEELKPISSVIEFPIYNGKYKTEISKLTRREAILKFNSLTAELNILFNNILKNLPE